MRQQVIIGFMVIITTLLLTGTTNAYLWNFEEGSGTTVAELNNVCDLSEVAGTGDFTGTNPLQGDYSWSFASTKLDDADCSLLNNVGTATVLWWWNTSSTAWQNPFDTPSRESAWVGTTMRFVNLCGEGNFDSNTGWGIGDGSAHQVGYTITDLGGGSYRWCWIHNNAIDTCAERSCAHAASDGIYIGHWSAGGDYAIGTFDYLYINNTHNATAQIISDHYNKNISESGRGSGSINITFISGTTGLQWDNRLPTITFIANETLTSARYKYGDSGTWRTITDLTSPHTFTMQDYAAITPKRGYELILETNSSVANTTTTINLSYSLPIDGTDLITQYQAIYLNSTQRSNYSSLANSSTSTEAEKLKKSLLEHTYLIEGTAFDYSNTSVGSGHMNDRAEDCLAAALVCNLEGNISLGFNSGLGSPTYACDLVKNNLENVLGGIETAGWDGEMLNLGKSGVIYYHCVATAWENITQSTKNIYWNNMSYLMLSAQYKAQQRESTDALISGSSNNFNNYLRTLQLDGYALNGLLFHNYTISPTKQYCDDMFDYSGTFDTCDGSYHNASDLFTELAVDTSNITGRDIYELFIDYNYGKWANAADEAAHPTYYGARGFIWQGAGAQGIPDSGTSYGGGWTHFGMDQLFNTHRDLTSVDPYDWYYDRFFNPLAAWMNTRLNHYIWQIGASSDSQGNWALANMGITNAYIDYELQGRNATMLGMLKYHLKTISDQDIYNRINNIQSLTNFLNWLRVEESFESGTPTNTELKAYNTTTIFEDDGFARMSDNRVSGLDIFIATGQNVPANDGKFNTPHVFAADYNNVSLISLSGTSSSSFIQSGTSAPVNGLWACNGNTDPSTQNEQDYYYVGTSQNSFWVEGKCPTAPSDSEDNIVSFFDDSLTNENVTVLESIGHYNDTNISSVDASGVWHEREYIFVRSQEVLFVIDTINETNETHETQFGIMLGEKNNVTPTISNITDKVTWCYNGECFQMLQSADATYNTYNMSGLGYVNSMDKLLSTQTSNYQITAFHFYTDGDTPATMTRGTSGSNKTITITTSTRIVQLNWQDDDNWITTFFYTNETAIWNANEANGFISYSTGGLDTITPGINTVSSSVDITSANITFNASEAVNYTIEYGINSSLLNTSSNDTFRLNHTVLLTGLVQETIYYYNITVWDAAGNSVENGTFNLTTNSIPDTSSLPTSNYLYPINKTFYQSWINLSGVGTDQENNTLSYRFYINNTLNITNSSGVNNTAWTVNQTMPFGNYTVIFEVCDQNTTIGCANSSSYWFSLRTAPANNPPLIFSTYPANNSIFLNQEWMNFSALIIDLDNITFYSWLIINGTVNQTNTTTNNNTAWTTNVTLPYDKYTYQYNASDGFNMSQSSLFTFTLTCNPLWTNTTWSSYTNTTCQPDNTYNYSRFLTQYDARACPSSNNKTYYDNGTDSCDYDNGIMFNAYNILGNVVSPATFTLTYLMEGMEDYDEGFTTQYQIDTGTYLTATKSSTYADQGSSSLLVTASADDVTNSGLWLNTTNYYNLSGATIITYRLKYRITGTGTNELHKVSLRINNTNVKTTTFDGTGPYNGAWTTYTYNVPASLREENLSVGFYVNMTEDNSDIRSYFYIDNVKVTRGFVDNKSINTSTIPIGTYDITAQNSTYYNKTRSITITGEGTYNITGMYQTMVNVTANEISQNTSINNWTITVNDNTNDLQNNYTTTTGNYTFTAMNNTNYTIIINTYNEYSSTNNEQNLTTDQTTEKIIFYLYYFNSLYIEYKDEETLATIDYTTINLEISSDDYANNYTTNNGTIYATGLSPGSYRSISEANGYDTRYYYFTLTNDTSQSLTLYMINSTNVFNLTITIINQNGDEVTDAIVKSKKYYISSNSYVVQESQETDIEGKVYFTVTDDQYWQFVVEYDGETVYTTTPQPIKTSSLTIQVILGEALTEAHDNFRTIDYSLTYSNSTDNFRFEYNNANGISTNMCLYVYQRRYTGETLLNNSCNTAGSATIIIPITTINGTTYIAKAYYTDLSSNVYYLASLTHTEPEGEVFGLTGLLIQLLITAAFIFIGLWNPSVAAITAPLSLLIGGFIGLHSIPTEYTAPIVVAGFILAFIMSKRT